jgi:phosphatidylglycerophosphate synthase
MRLHLYFDRKLIDNILAPITNWLYIFKLTANQVSFAKGLVLLVSAYLLYLRFFVYTIVLLMFANLLDFVDGALARKSRKTEYGFFFDCFADSCFGVFPVIAVYIAGLASFESTLFFASSMILSCLVYVYYYFKRKKKYALFTIGSTWLIIFFIILKNAYVNSIIFIIVSAINYVNIFLVYADSKFLSYFKD